MARAQLAWGSVFGDQEFISSVVPELGGMLSGHGISKVCSDGPVIKRMRDLVGVGNLDVCRVVFPSLTKSVLFIR